MLIEQAQGLGGIAGLQNGKSGAFKAIGDFHARKGFVLYDQHQRLCGTGNTHLTSLAIFVGFDAFHIGNAAPAPFDPRFTISW
jgi:hypothetical protein